MEEHPNTGGFRVSGYDSKQEAGMVAVARLAGFEPAAYGLEVRCSIQLSYRRLGDGRISQIA